MLKVVSFSLSGGRRVRQSLTAGGWRGAARVSGLTRARARHRTVCRGNLTREVQGRKTGICHTRDVKLASDTRESLLSWHPLTGSELRLLCAHAADHLITLHVAAWSTKVFCHSERDIQTETARQINSVCVCV